MLKHQRMQRHQHIIIHFIIRVIIQLIMVIINIVRKHMETVTAIINGNNNMAQAMAIMVNGADIAVADTINKFPLRILFSASFFFLL